jgi:ribonuclease P protein component
MTPPEAGATGSSAGSPVQPAVCVCLTVLSKRADFLRAAQARRQATPGFLLQARRRGDDSADIRIGYTCSRKIGNAVTRNRAKRRLREVARATLPAAGLPGWDYVLVGRPGATVERPFSDLLADMANALGRVHADRAPR